MEVSSVMNRRVAALGREASLVEASKLMRDEDVGCILVEDEGHKPMGIVTDRDMVTRAFALGHEPSKVTVESVMSRHPFTVKVSDSVMIAARKMADKGVRRLPVVDTDGSLLGLVSVDDLLTIFITELSNVAAAVVGSSKLLG